MVAATTNQRLQNQKVYGFDYLRAVFSIFVVYWHLFPVYNIKIKNFTSGLIDIIDYNVVLLAVPVFLQISLFLFYYNRSKKENYLEVRLLKLLKLYLFWVSAITLFEFANHHIFQVVGANIITTLIVFIASGRDSLFFFFFTLILLTGLAELIWRLSTNPNGKFYFYILFSGSCLIVLLGPWVEILIGNNSSFFTSFWNPLNFLPYSFSSLILFNLFAQNKIWSRGTLKGTIIPFFLISLLLIGLEWYWLYVSHLPLSWGIYILPPYSRLSLLLSSSLLILLVLRCPFPPPKIFQILSNYSLGIYCLHPFINSLINQLIIVFPNSYLKKICSLLAIFVVVLFSIALTKQLRKVRFFQSFV